MLGKRGLYATLGGRSDSQEHQMAALWVLNWSDGDHSLLDISNKARICFSTIKTAADALVECGLLEKKQMNKR